jgi:hypothetical protein
MVVTLRRYSASCKSLEQTYLFFIVMLSAVIVMLSAVDCILAQSYKVDGPDSQSLTNYLRQHRLPLVGAQVLEDSAGNRRIVLYGFVATQFGRNDAAREALSYQSEYRAQPGTPAPPLENHIEIRPEIARMRTRAAGPAADTSKKSLNEVLSDIDHYGVKLVPAQLNPK